MASIIERRSWSIPYICKQGNFQFSNMSKPSEVCLAHDIWVLHDWPIDTTQTIFSDGILWPQGWSLHSQHACCIICLCIKQEVLNLILTSIVEHPYSLWISVLYRVRSWNNGMHRMSYCVLMVYTAFKFKWHTHAHRYTHIHPLISDFFLCAFCFANFVLF